MRAAGVVVHPPRLDEGPGRRQAPEQVLVQALVAQAPVQAFSEAVLLRLAGRDVMPASPTIAPTMPPRDPEGNVADARGDGTGSRTGFTEDRGTHKSAPERAANRT